MSNCHAEKVNEVLRCELAATETYQKALAKMDGAPCVSELRMIHDHHANAADVLRQEIHFMGCEPGKECESWNRFARVIEEIPRRANHEAALRALMEGEEMGAHSYEDVLHDQFLPVTCQALIKTKLLPQIKNHIHILNQCMRGH